MASVTLAAAPRTDTGKGVARSLRRAGRVPAVIYGHSRQSQPLSIDARELERLLERITPESTVVELQLDDATTRTLIREIQRHPFKRHVLHVDFQELVAGEKVTVNVPLVLVGTAEGVRAGGVLDQTMRELEIEVDPANIPNHIDVDVSGLTIGHSLHVRDLQLPTGVAVLDEPDKSVCSVTAPRTATETAAAEPTETAAEPEVIRKAKTEDEGEK